MGKISKLKRVRSFVSNHKAAITTTALVGATVGMQMFAAHNLMPGYGVPIPLSDGSNPIQTIHSLGSGLSELAYNISDELSKTTTNFDPQAPFFYKGIIQDKTFSTFYNSVHHTVGGMAVAYPLKKFFIEPKIKEYKDDKENIREKSIEIEEFLKRNDKRVSNAYSKYFWSTVVAASLVWEAYEMNFFSDKIVSIPTFLSNPDTWDGAKDIFCDFLGAGIIYNSGKIKRTFSKVYPKNSKESIIKGPGGGKL